MSNMQKGFTLIELVVVIVILGILAATALPKFVDLTSDAKTAAVAGYAGAITSGNNINYATYLARRTNSTLTGTTTGVIDTSGGCTGTTVADNLLSASSQLPTGYVVSLSSGATTAAGADAVCNLFTTGATTATFILTGAK